MQTIYSFMPIPSASSLSADFYQAAIDGNLQTLQQLLQLGINSRLANEEGYTALDLAIYHHQNLAASLLLEQEPLLNFGSRALNIALGVNNTEVAERITQHPYFNADEVAYRAFCFKQYSILEYFAEQHISTPLVDTLINAKLMAHRFGLTGKITLTFEQKPMPISLEGFYNYYTVKAAAQSFQDFVEHLAQISPLPEYFSSYERIVKALNFSANAQSGQEYMSLLEHSMAEQSPMPIFVPTGWNGHSVGIVIFGNTLFKCNRALQEDKDHGIYAYKIGNFEGFSSELFDRLLSYSELPTFVRFELNRILDLKEIERFESDPQIINNCAWVSIVESVRAMLIAELAFQSYHKELSIKLADKIFSEWENFDLSQSISHFSLAQDPVSHQIEQDILKKILYAQHKIYHPEHLERAQLILKHLDNPEQVLQQFPDRDFVQGIKISQYLANHTKLYLEQRAIAPEILRFDEVISEPLAQHVSVPGSEPIFTSFLPNQDPLLPLIGFANEVI